MPENGHVIITANGPALALNVSLHYTAAVRVFDVLAGDGTVEAHPEFSALLSPGDAPAGTVAMLNATPEYLAQLTSQLQTTLNNVALADVCTLIEAMFEAGTPEEMGELAWAEVEQVYENALHPGPSPQDETYSCIIVGVNAPGSGNPPP